MGGSIINPVLPCLKEDPQKKPLGRKINFEPVSARIILLKNITKNSKDIQLKLRIGVIKITSAGYRRPRPSYNTRTRTSLLRRGGGRGGAIVSQISAAC